jgi:hypothetical protein
MVMLVRVEHPARRRQREYWTMIVAYKHERRTERVRVVKASIIGPYLGRINFSLRSLCLERPTDCWATSAGATSVACLNERSEDLAASARSSKSQLPALARSR